MDSVESEMLFKKFNVAVLIPTYNNEQTVSHVIRSVLDYTKDVIVVNDGSTDSTLSIAREFPDIDLVSYPKNVGKGFALRMGFKRALELGYDYVISIDSDGQHFAEDLPQFIAKLETHRDSIIMGVRNMEQAGIPGKSSFGHKFSNFWFWVETGVRMNDTQSGYRLYPVKLLQSLSFITRKFEFEIEVIVRSVWRGISITEVPVKVFYAKKEDRISHFRPFQDFTRISILNTVLVTMALLYIKPRDFLRRAAKREGRIALRDQFFRPGESDATKAISIGFGVFMGIVPLWGFQLVIAIAAAIFFRLNKLLVILAANISIPPMIPLILFLSYLTGTLWMGDHAHYLNLNEKITLSLALNHSLQYILGAITLAIFAGMLFGLVTLFVLKLVRKKNR